MSSALTSLLHEKLGVPSTVATYPWLGQPKLGIVCGSGLSLLESILENKVEINYADIEGFPRTTVPGHRGCFAFGYLRSSSGDRVPVVCQLGRFHMYEGHAPSNVILPIRLMHKLGVKSVILTNAAGGLNHSLKVGSILVMRDHIGFPSLTSPLGPLFGPNDDNLGPRFLATSDAYSWPLRKALFRAAKSLDFEGRGIMVEEGTYGWVTGPTYETRAEAKFLKDNGADVVGMSTVPEVLAARHLGMNVLALSLVTNAVVLTPYRSAKEEIEKENGVPVTFDWEEKEDTTEKASHEEVLETGRLRAEDLRDLVKRLVEIVPF